MPHRRTIDAVAAAMQSLAAAAEWHLLALLLERPREGWSAEVATLSDELGNAALCDLARRVGLENEGDYLRLIGPGGAISPREVGHRPFHDPGWILADITRFHEAFGFQPRVEDPIDHVAVEAEFVAYLHLKEAYARANGDEDAVAVAARAREDFIEAHLSAFAQPLARRLEAIRRSALAEAAAALAERVPAPVAPNDRALPPGFAEGCLGCPS